MTAIAQDRRSYGRKIALPMSPIFAGFAMALSSAGVLTNALRLNRFRPPMAADATSAAQTRIAFAR